MKETVRMLADGVLITVANPSESLDDYIRRQTTPYGLLKKMNRKPNDDYSLESILTAAQLALGTIIYLG